MKQRPLAERHHPLYSPLSLILAAGLIAVVGIGIYLTNGQAFNPNSLSGVASGFPLAGFVNHVEFQEDCHACHMAWRGISAGKCEQCHENVAVQRQAGNGLHGGFEEAANCAACHREHQGVDYMLSAQAVAEFDHANKDFTLAKHPMDDQMSCVSCHSDDTHFPEQPYACLTCHIDENQPWMETHQANFGGDCLACHDGDDSLAQLSVAEHDRFFPLLGAHQTAECANCHAGIDSFVDFSPRQPLCVDCHAEPLSHAGMGWMACDACHSVDAFHPVELNAELFDHQRDTTFSLAKHPLGQSEGSFACSHCHAAERFDQTSISTCRDCHAKLEANFIAAHVDQFGESCLACHDGVDRMSAFNHDDRFPLDGAHAGIECAACHMEQNFAGISGDCIACHAEPTVHNGIFGERCAACHTTDGWLPASLRVHTFPLDHGGEGQIPCATCHAQSYPQYSCAACHHTADISDAHFELDIGAELLLNCIACHPTGAEDEASQFWEAEK